MKAFAADFLLPFFAPLDSSGLWTALALTSGFLRVVIVVTGERTENGAGPVVLKRRDALRTLDPGRAASRRLASRPSLATSIAAMPAYPQSSDGQRECFTGFASSCIAASGRKQLAPPKQVFRAEMFRILLPGEGPQRRMRQPTRTLRQRERRAGTGIADPKAGSRSSRWCSADRQFERWRSHARKGTAPRGRSFRDGY